MFGIGGKPADSRGFALYLTLLALVVLSIAAAGFMLLSNVETRVAGHNLRGSQALRIAEAGVAEAMSRIRSGDVPNRGNPKMVAQIFLVEAGRVPVLGADSVALATAQPHGAWLPYSTPDRTDRVLTVRYKTNSDRSMIYRYDAAKSPPVQTESGLPIFEIASTGRKGMDRRRIVTDVVQKPLNPVAKAALAADKGIRFSGNSDVCGFNHSSDTPAGTKGRGPCLDWEIASGHMPGAWSTGAVTQGGSSSQYGDPVGVMPHQIGFYRGPWEALGMGQNDFFLWLGAPARVQPEPPRGIIHLDSNDRAQDQSGSFQYNGGSGEGLLYVDGDLTLNGNFTHHGLIYIEGDLKINGTCWILGAIIVRGKTTIKIANGSCTVLYSMDAIRESISKYGGQLVTVAWLETN